MKFITKPLIGAYKSGKWVSIPDASITKNGISEIFLRTWQKELLCEVEKINPLHLFINCPTGSGKSKAVLSVISQVEKDSNKLVIISTPQREIGRGFLSSRGNPQKINGHIWLINPQNHLCEGYYKNEDGNIARLLEFLKSKRSSDLNERVLICCHATLSMLFDRLSASDKKEYLKDIKLCIDESHHSLSQEESGNGLGKVVNYFLKNSKRNMDLIMMTATPFRGDKGSLIPEKYLNDFHRYDLDYGRHFEENCAGLEFTFNAVLHQYGNSYGVVIEELMNKYIERGDNILVHIPPSNKNISNGKFSDLLMIYDAIGTDKFVDDDGIVNITRGSSVVRVVDLVTEKDRENRLKYLRDNPNDIDVVIGIAMIKEGFDWPPANAGILIGSQGSLNAQIQLMGRMFRAHDNKGKDNGKCPVEISQIFPYIDHEKLDKDEVKDQINSFMNVVYSALAMELVINPVHIDIPSKGESKSQTRNNVKNFLKENLTDVQYIELMTHTMDEFRDWKATLSDDNDNNADKITDIVTDKLIKLGIEDNHKEIAAFFNKSLQRSAKFQLMGLNGIDASHVDIDLMKDIEDPITSILLGMTNGLCGVKNIREFQALLRSEIDQNISKLREHVSIHGWKKLSKQLSRFLNDFKKWDLVNLQTKKFTQNHRQAIYNIEGYEKFSTMSEIVKREFIKKQNNNIEKNSVDETLLYRYMSGGYFTEHKWCETEIGKIYISYGGEIDYTKDLIDSYVYNKKLNNNSELITSFEMRLNDMYQKQSLSDKEIKKWVDAGFKFNDIDHDERDLQYAEELVDVKNERYFEEYLTSDKTIMLGEKLERGELRHDVMEKLNEINTNRYRCYGDYNETFCSNWKLVKDLYIFHKMSNSRVVFGFKFGYRDYISHGWVVKHLKTKFTSGEPFFDFEKDFMYEIKDRFCNIYLTSK